MSATALAQGLRTRLAARRNEDGGWAYAPGRRSRIEPTCWALLALAAAARERPVTHVLRTWPRAGGWLVDVAGAPHNVAFNAIAGLTMLDEPAAGLPGDVPALIADTRGMRLPQDENLRQDNSLRAWSWLAGTFSWAEPTAWCLLLLKKYAATRPASNVQTRIRTGEAMLIDRVCEPGGWNYGNANVLGQNLHPYVPTTALGLLALQDHGTHPVVQRSLQYLEGHQVAERSCMALSLTIICLRVFGVPAAGAERALADLCDGDGADLIASSNLHGLGMALYALSLGDAPPRAFLL